MTSKVENKRLYARQMVVLPPNNVLLCSGGGSLFGEWIGNGHLLQWSSSRRGRGEMRPMGVSIVLRLAKDAAWQEGRAGGELVLDSKLDIFPLYLPLPTTSLFCLPASVLPQFPPPFSTLCCAVQLLSNVQNHPALVRLKCHASMQGRI